MVTDEGGKGVDAEHRRDKCADRWKLGEKEVIGRMRDGDGGVILPEQQRRGQNRGVERSNKRSV